MSDPDWPTTAEWWLTVSGIEREKAIWNRMDKSEHVGYKRDKTEDYDGDDKFVVFKGDGLHSKCSDCGHHLLYPEDFLGYAPTEHEAAQMVQEYCEGVADRVTWTGTPPINRRPAKHPRAQWWWA